MEDDRAIDELAEAAYRLASDTWRRRFGPIYYDEKYLEAATDLLTQAHVLTADSTSPPQDRRRLD
jgi:hypothetical protein